MYENKKDKTIPSKLREEIYKLFVVINFCIPNKLTADSAGIDNKKDIFAESTLLK